MRIGLFLTVQWPPGSDQQRRYRETIEQCVLAEELGYDSVWLTEHHFTRHGITSDSLVLLAHIAARTEQVRLGTAVLVLPFHDPIRLAEQIALVDHLSNGRLDVGIGRGYQWAEYNGFGIGFDEGSDRFEEALAVLLQAWDTEAPVAFSGTYHSYNAAFAQPRPVQRPHPPLWHATTSDDGNAPVHRERLGDHARPGNRSEGRRRPGGRPARAQPRAREVSPARPVGPRSGHALRAHRRRS